MSIFADLKNKLIRKIATSFILGWADGKKTELARIVQAVNMLIAALYLSLPVLDAQFGTEISKNLDFVNEKWLLGLQFLGHLGLELGIADKKAKEKLAEKEPF